MAFSIAARLPDQLKLAHNITPRLLLFNELIAVKRDGLHGDWGIEVFDHLPTERRQCSKSRPVAAFGPCNEPTNSFLDSDLCFPGQQPLCFFG
jgi:hypothetical protein